MQHSDNSLSQYSLERLHDIVLPDPPPLWPPTSELALSLLLLGAAVLVALVQWRRRRRRNAYRVEGLALLADARSLHQVSVVLKRVALAAYPRERVASLVGPAWAEFLHRTGGGDLAALAEALTRAVPGAPPAGPASAPPSPELVAQAARWIRRHRGEPRGAA